MKYTFHDLAEKNFDALERIVADSEAPALEDVAGYEYRGWNVLPWFGQPLFWALSNIRFIKCFGAIDESQGEPTIPGFNMMVTRGDRYSPWKAGPTDAKPKQVGRYRLWAPDAHPRSQLYPNAAFFDYRQPGNHLFSGSTITDYMITPNANNADVLIGKAYLDLGPARFGSFFILERLQPLRAAYRAEVGLA